MIKCINIESVLGNLALKIFLLNNVLPELARALCTRHTTGQAYNGSGVVVPADAGFVAMAGWGGGD